MILYLLVSRITGQVVSMYADVPGGIVNAEGAAQEAGRVFERIVLRVKIEAITDVVGGV